MTILHLLNLILLRAGVALTTISCSYVEAENGV